MDNSVIYVDNPLLTWTTSPAPVDNTPAPVYAIALPDPPIATPVQTQNFVHASHQVINAEHPLLRGKIAAVNPWLKLLTLGYPQNQLPYYYYHFIKYYD